MRKLISCIAAMLFVCLLIGCSDAQQMKKDRRYMTTPNISYVKAFPKKISLTNPIVCNSQLADVSSCLITGPYIIACTGEKQKAWKIIDLESGNIVAGIFNVGNSKEEFLFPPSVTNGSSFYEKNDSLYADVFDGIKGRMLTVNIDESVKKQSLCLKAEKSGLDNSVFTAMRVADSQYLIRKVSADQKTLGRSVRNLVTGVSDTLAVFESLNEASLKNGADINLLSCGIAIAKNGCVVEAPVSLNYINVYKLDGSIARTVCMGDALDNIDDLAKKKMMERKFVFSDVRVFDDFFGVLMLNETWGDYIAHKEIKPSILLFSYNGEPLAEVTLDVTTLLFDIDTKRGMLYAVDGKTGHLVRYDVRKALGFLPIK